jgi:hypothetical protein
VQSATGEVLRRRRQRKIGVDGCGVTAAEFEATIAG